MSGKEVVPGKGNRNVRSSEVTWSLALGWWEEPVEAARGWVTRLQSGKTEESFYLPGNLPFLRPELFSLQPYLYQTQVSMDG